ncbi:hypothetical protein ACLI1A_17050 [Flavobacterium sp. RHBU_3]
MSIVVNNANDSTYNSKCNCGGKPSNASIKLTVGKARPPNQDS